MRFTVSIALGFNPGISILSLWALAQCLGWAKAQEKESIATPWLKPRAIEKSTVIIRSLLRVEHERKIGIKKSSSRNFFFFSTITILLILFFLFFFKIREAHGETPTGSGFHGDFHGGFLDGFFLRVPATAGSRRFVPVETRLEPPSVGSFINETIGLVFRGDCGVVTLVFVGFVLFRK